MWLIRGEHVLGLRRHGEWNRGDAESAENNNRNICSLPEFRWAGPVIVVVAAAVGTSLVTVSVAPKKTVPLFAFLLFSAPSASLRFTVLSWRIEFPTEDLPPRTASDTPHRTSPRG